MRAAEKRTMYVYSRRPDVIPPVCIPHVVLCRQLAASRIGATKLWPLVTLFLSPRCWLIMSESSHLVTHMKVKSHQMPLCWYTVHSACVSIQHFFIFSISLFEQMFVNTAKHQTIIKQNLQSSPDRVQTFVRIWHWNTPNVDVQWNIWGQSTQL